MAVKGLAKTIADLRRFGQEAEDIIAAKTLDAALSIEEEAKRLAPKNFGDLAQTISHSKINDANYKVTVNEYYGAYMEFGTGTKVKVPAEFASMAATFKGSRGGTFEQGLEAIKVWCHHKGIDEKAAYPIFAKILGAGVNPQPFLYPAWIKGKKDYEADLKVSLERFKRRI